ncbi:hypothetical protein [uncultured Akkermansia sp.]|uniref:hypothetical protein n=1 Tax=Akkermansia sp. TaxID=1872421 RepID=UPI0025CEB319|nr:hypothetical protein [uncultured Akkermansia sp.]
MEVAAIGARMLFFERISVRVLPSISDTFMPGGCSVPAKMKEGQRPVPAIFCETQDNPIMTEAWGAGWLDMFRRNAIWTVFRCFLLRRRTLRLFSGRRAGSRVSQDIF